MSTGSASGAESQSGAKALGGFHLIARIGQGAMGAVFKARQVSVDRIVALKVLPQRLAKNQDFVARFLREARSAAKLNHPNIVQAIDAGHADGYYYFAMEFVDGRTLHAALNSEGLVPELRALEIARDMAAALEHAHAAGIVHRDIKPGNILIGLDGTVKLADLGLAREAQRGDSSLTQVGTALGTPDYISPEQVRGDADIDGRTDLYSLGATLYHMLVGFPPYTGGTTTEVMSKHLTEPVPDPRWVNPQVSFEASRIVRKAMAKKREQRYANAREFLLDVEKLIAAEQAGKPHVTVAGLVSRSPLEAAAAVRSRPRSRTRVFVATGAALVVPLVVLGFWLARPAKQPPPAPPSPGAGTVAQRPSNVPPSSLVQEERKVGSVTTPDLETPGQRAQKADEAFAVLYDRAEQFAMSGNYDAALAVYNEAPSAFADLLAPRVKAETDKLRAGAESRIAAAIAQARKLSEEGEPLKGIDALNAISAVKYAPRMSDLQNLRTELETASRNAGEINQKRARAAVYKLLDTIDAAAAKKDFDEVDRLAGAAAKDPALQPAAAELKAVLSVAAALRTVAEKQAGLDLDALKKLKGRTLVFPTAHGTKSGTVKDVTDAAIVLDEAAPADASRPTITIPFTDLADAMLAQFRAKWSPETPDEAIAAVISALANGDAKEGAAFLTAVQRHTLHDRYRRRVEELRISQLETDAKQFWSDKIARFLESTELDKTHALAAVTALSEFETRYDETQFMTGVNNDIHAFRERLERVLKNQVTPVPPEQRKVKMPEKAYMILPNTLTRDLELPYGTHTLRQSLEVPDGITLRITAGTTVLCAPNAELLVHGTLVVEGRQEQPIVFVAAGQRWKGIRIVKHSGKSSISWAIIRDADVGLTTWGMGGQVQHVAIVHCGVGIRRFCQAGRLDINDVLVCDNSGDGVIIENSYCPFRSLTVRNNGGSGIVAIGQFAGKIENSIVTGNEVYGVWRKKWHQDNKDGGGLDVTGSVICDNRRLEFRNDGVAACEARGNYWGQRTTLVLKKHAASASANPPNLRQISDLLDDKNCGIVRIDDWKTELPEGIGASKAVEKLYEQLRVNSP